MSASTVADRIGLAGLAASQALAAVRRCAMRPFRFLEKLRAHTPERLLIAPQDIRTADPTVAEDIYAGYYAMGGKIVNAHGRSPFEIESPSPSWSAALAGFGWLRHLRAADTALARSNARALVDDWIAIAGIPDDSPGWRPPIAARRLLSWLSQSPLILDGADRGFYRRFMRALGRHSAYLQSALSEGMRGEQRLVAIIALAELGLCAADLAALQRTATRLLEQEIDGQMLPDGGHLGRSPQTLIDLLLDLLPLRQAFAARGADAPQPLLNAIDRMTPMLRLFRHANGEVALFNGMGVTQPDAVATVLAYDDVRAKPIVNAPSSGYQRLEGVDCVLVMDTGRPPPPRFSMRAHAGALSFELSSGAHRLVVNCGAPDTARSDLREAARASAAHSTLVIDDLSSCRFASHAGLDRWLRGQIVAGPSHVEARRIEDSAATTLEASHDGYKKRFGLVHARRLRLLKDGSMLAGEDTLEAAGPRRPELEEVEFAVRFHLHPATAAMLGEAAQDVDLTLADGQIWRFRTDGQAVAIEESIFFAGPNGPRPSLQLVIRRRLGESTSVSWSFERRATPA